MKHTPIFCVALFAGAAAGVAVTVVTRLAGTDSVGMTTAPVESVVANVDIELRAELEKLRNENRSLSERVGALELRPVEPARAPVEGYVTEETFEAFKREIESALVRASIASDSPAQAAEFQKSVADALSAVRKEERVAKVRSYHEKRVARIEEDLDKIQDRLGLDTNQVKDMRRALLAQYERETELTRLWEEGADDEFLGERKQADHEAFRQEIEGFLTPEQNEGFWEMARGRGGR